MFFVDRPWDSFSWKKWMASASNTRNCYNSTFMGFASYLSSEAFSQQFLHLSLSRLEDIYWSGLHDPLQLGWISNRVWLGLNLRLIWLFFFCSLFVSSVDLRQRLLNLLQRWGCHDSLIWKFHHEWSSWCAIIFAFSSSIPDDHKVRIHIAGIWKMCFQLFWLSSWECLAIWFWFFHFRLFRGVVWWCFTRYKGMRVWIFR